MGEEAILRQMKEFDFNKPIITTISYEDSDEDLDEISFNVHDKYTGTNVPKTTINDNLRKAPNKEHSPLNTISTICNSVETNAPQYVNSNYTQDQSVHLTAKNLELSSVNNLNRVEINNYIDLSSSSSQENRVFTLHSGNTNSTILNNEQVINGMMTDYIRKQLYIVSKHLLCILMAYRKHDQIINSHETILYVKEKSRNHFMNIKQYFFKSSYPIIMTLFLSEQKYDYFKKLILQYTLKQAKETGFYCTYIDTLNIFVEMMEWSYKEKRNDTIRHNNTSHSEQKQSSNHLSSIKKNSKILKQTHRKTSPPYRDPKTRNIFTSGPPGREIQINVNQNVFANISNSSIPLQTANSSNINNYSRHNPMTTNLNGRNNSMSIQNNNLAQNQPNEMYSTIPTSSPTYGTNQTVYQNHNYTPQFTSIETERPIQMNPMGYRPKSITDETSVRSSDSRDSGFISPSNFKCSNEQTNIVIEDITPNITVYPSNISSTNIGSWASCNTCGRNTILKCLQCKKTYYCSQVCWTFDWSHHINICQPIAAKTAQL